MEKASSVQPVNYLFAHMLTSDSQIRGRADRPGRPEDADQEVTHKVTHKVAHEVAHDRLHRHRKESEPLLAKLEDQGFQVKRISSDI
ncbi:hypothetical protein PG994_012050 [Apiospora phragmitis]|uniref:Uncharacterized protein n=1 Tax=Apiospora phragmitis TaxID=2905665 RepID=A0ABR1TUI1_9PEZI